MLNSPPEASLREWLDFVEMQFLPEFRDAAIAHVVRLIEKNARVIFDSNHLALLTGFKPKALRTVIHGTHAFYREFEIPKRNGGIRIIQSPYPSLLELQRWIVSNVLQRQPIHECAHGFVRGRSISTNAAIHLGASSVLKIDIKDFFPSITLPRVIGIFSEIGYSPEVSYSLARICTLSGALPQGAGTSPAIANLVARTIDNRVAGLAANLDLKYSRYADDITLSGSYIPASIMPFVYKIIAEEGFAANEQKTRLIRGNGKKIVTGISVGTGRPKLPRSSRRSLRAEAHWALKSGVQEYVSQKRINDPQYLQRLLGRVAFWLSVEPDCGLAKTFHRRLRDILRAGAGVS